MNNGARFSVGFRVSLASLAFLAIGTEARPDAIRHSITYSTSMEFGFDGRSRTLPGVSFQGVENQTVQAAAPFPKDSFPWTLPDGSTVDFPLGKLLVELPSDGVQHGGDHFILKVRVDAIDGARLAEPLTADLQGRFQGALNASGESNLDYGIIGVMLHPPYTPPLPDAGSFVYGDIAHHILLPDSAYGRPSFSSNQEFSLDAKLISSSTVNTPEPSTWAIFSMAAVGAWWSRRRCRPAAPRSS